MKKIIAIVFILMAVAVAVAGQAHAAKPTHECPVGAMCWPVDVTPTPSY